MSGVVLRCPSCGTTQAHLGECDACYEAQVRYFCDNHTPGLWIDQPQCTTCGARYGEAPKRPVTPVATSSAPRAAPTPPRGPGARRAGRTTMPPPRLSDRPKPPPGPPDLAELLHRALGGRAHDGYGGEPSPPAPPPIARSRLGGCLGKLMLFFLIVFVFMIMGSFSLLQFLFGGW